MFKVAARHTEDLRWCVTELLRERGVRATELLEELGAETEDVPDLPAGELWRMFRALVNTRPPEPASAGFLAAQDHLLQGLIADAGVTDAATLPAVAADARLSIWRGDITTLAADAIVNAANSQMLGCWQPGHACIDNAIHTFAGVQLRLECAALMRAQGHKELSGCAKVTAAYNLPARYVIHTVGPIVSSAPTARDDELLARCYTSCLDAAAEHGCATVAFCCISTGVFGFPQERAARVTVATVRAWLDARESRMVAMPADAAGGVSAADDPARMASAPTSADSGTLTTIPRVIFNVFSARDEEIYHDILD